MRDLRLVASITIVAGALAVAIPGCGDDEAAPVTTQVDTTAPILEAPEPATPPEKNDAREAGARKGGRSRPDEDAASPELSRSEREAVATARRYVAALDARDGARVCALLVPGAIGTVKLPRDRSGCAASLDASIGYQDPRGLPVWKSAEIEAIASVKVSADESTVIPTVFTVFADRDEPSIEDDPIYLTRSGDGWLVAKPSLTLYRAVGQEPPPQALSPP